MRLAIAERASPEVRLLDLLSRRVLFHFEVTIHRLPRRPVLDGNPRKWTDRHMAPPLHEIDDRPAIGDVYWAWSNDAFYLAVDVPNRTRPPVHDPKQWWKGDGVRLCLDTRPSRENKRATRFCRFFYFLPVGGGRGGEQPIVGTQRLSRAKEPAPAIDVSLVEVVSRVTRKGYYLEAVIPASCLTGWQPAEHGRIGVYYKIKDLELGEQHFTVGDDMGWQSDPSTWAIGVLDE